MDIKKNQKIIPCIISENSRTKVIIVSLGGETWFACDDDGFLVPSGVRAISRLCGLYWVFESAFVDSKLQYRVWDISKEIYELVRIAAKSKVEFNGNLVPMDNVPFQKNPCHAFRAANKKIGNNKYVDGYNAKPNFAISFTSFRKLILQAFPTKTFVTISPAEQKNESNGIQHRYEMHTETPSTIVKCNAKHNRKRQLDQPVNKLERKKRGNVSSIFGSEIYLFLEEFDMKEFNDKMDQLCNKQELCLLEASLEKIG